MFYHMTAHDSLFSITCFMTVLYLVMLSKQLGLDSKVDPLHQQLQTTFSRINTNAYMQQLLLSHSLSMNHTMHSEDASICGQSQTLHQAVGEIVLGHKAWPGLGARINRDRRAQ